VKVDIKFHYGVARDSHAIANRNEAGVFETYAVRPRREVNRIRPVILRPQLPVQPLALNDDARAPGTYTPTGSETRPASLPSPPDGACCATAFTVRQKTKANNRDFASILSLTVTQETFSGRTLEINGEHESEAVMRVRLGDL
jgi:hypothetical protein